MKPGFVSYIRTLLTIIFLSWGVIPEVFAGCNISGNGGNPARVQFSVPALDVNSDAVPGTIIATVNANSPSISVSCTANGEIWQGYTVLTNLTMCFRLMCQESVFARRGRITPVRNSPPDI